jgi:hypothetical protein
VLCPARRGVYEFSSEEYIDVFKAWKLPCHPGLVGSRPLATMR